MSMRVAWTLLPFLLACRPAHDPESIRRALAKTPIDVAALEEAFHAEPNALKIHAPALPSITLKPPTEPWVLENVSARPVWIARSSLVLAARHEPLLRSRTGFMGGGRLEQTILRPEFEPAKWLLLAPGGRTAIAVPAGGWSAGELRLTAEIGAAGSWMVHRAREFNDQRRARFDRPPLALHEVRTLILPPFDWPGAPWHGECEIEPLPLPGGRFEWITSELSEDVLGTPALEAFVADYAGNVLWTGDLDGTSIVDDADCRRSTYDLPAALPRGPYRLLVRSLHAAGYFLGTARHACDAPDGAASRWIPFRLD